MQSAHNPHLIELQLLIAQCLTDNKVLLQLEHQINQAVTQNDTKNIFLYLCQIVGEPKLPEAQRYLAAVVLKNTLQNHVIQLAEISPQELSQVKQFLATTLAQSNSMNASETPRKILKEIIFVVSKVTVKEFMQDAENSPFLQSLVEAFGSQPYSQVTTRLMVQIFKDMQDDRMSKFVPLVLATASRHLQSD